MAREQQFNNGQRQVINTIEDTSKYQTGDGRRLRIASDPLYIPQATQVSGLSQLAEALGTIKPELMSWAVDKKAEEYSKEITSGQTKALRHASPEEVKGEMEKQGFDTYGGYLGGEELGDKLENEWKSTPRTEGMDFDSWYKDWWATNADPSLSGKSPVYLDKFNTAFGKNLVAIQTAHAKEQQGFLIASQEDKLSSSVLGSIIDAKSKGKEFSAGDLEAISGDIRSFAQNLQPGRVDELTYQAALRYATDSKDTSVLKPFFDKKSDGTPAFADKKYNETSRWGDRIRADISAIKTESYNAQIRDSKILDMEKEAQRNAVYTKMLTSDYKDEDIQAVTREMAAKGLFSNIAEADAEAGHLISLNKRQESKGQIIKALELRSQIYEGRGIKPSEIIEAYRKEEISKEGANAAMAEYESKVRQDKSDAKAAATAGRTQSQLYKDITYGRGKEMITNLFAAKFSSLTPDDADKKEALGLQRAAALQQYAYKAMTATSPTEMLQFGTDISTQYQLTLEEGEPPLDPKLNKYINK